MSVGAVTELLEEIENRTSRMRQEIDQAPENDRLQQEAQSIARLSVKLETAIRSDRDDVVGDAC